LDALPGTALEGVSSLYRTRPVDASGPDYLNAVACIRSALGPEELLRALLELETDHQRERPYLNAPRTLDLDLLWYGGLSHLSYALTLPHPRMMQRAFVLVPLAELLTHLAGGEPELAAAMPDQAARDALAAGQGIEQTGTLASWNKPVG
jgi:2-amino-4-hydroxy-6-hydroxymethyldihydropteridine diphosphokinase